MRESRVGFANEVVDSTYPAPLQFSRVLFCAMPLPFLFRSWLFSESDCVAEIRIVIAYFISPRDDSKLVFESELDLALRPVSAMNGIVGNNSHQEASWND